MANKNNSRPAPWHRKPKMDEKRGGLGKWLNYRRKRFWALAFVLLYLLAGYLLVPYILRREIVATLEKTLDRPAQLETVRIDPVVFSAELRNFRIDEKDGTPIAGFDRFYARFSLASLFHWAWTIDRIELEGAKGNFVRFAATDSNFSRLIASIPADPAPAAAPQPEKAAAQPRVIVNQLKIVNASADIEDRTPGTPFKTTVGPVNVEINRLSTLPDASGDQHILVELEGGATLEWTAKSGLKPLASAGHVAAKGAYVPLIGRYVGEMVKLSIPTGTIDLAFDYNFQERPDGTLSLSLDNAGFALDDLTVREPGADKPFLTLPQLRLSGGHLAWPENQANADSLIVTGLDIAAGRNADGSLKPSLPTSTAVPATEATPQPPENAGSDWTITLNKAELKGTKLAFDDRAIGEPGVTTLGPVDFTIEGLTNKPGAAFPFSLSAGMPIGGQVKADGRLSVLPDLTAETKVTALDVRIAAIQRYLHDFARIAIDDGTISADADIKFRPASGVDATGKLDIRSLKLTDEVEKRPVLGWGRFGIDRYEFHQSGNELQISQAILDTPYLRVHVASDQTTNFSHLVKEQKPAPKPASKPAAKAPAAHPPADTGAQIPMKISVGKFTVQKGTVDYSDASLPLPFSAHITDFKGDVSAIDTGSSQPARVALRGQVGQYGQARIDGRVTPFDPPKNTKIGLVFRNVEFPDLSPYTVKFAGRRIAHGRLDVDLQYAINEGRLNGSNKVVIRDIELGEHVDVPGAMNLPLELAIALLKDSDGKIDVDLAVSGNMNDPQFDIGSVVTKAIFRVLTNLITAPFRALASLFGGGDDLGQVMFAAGSAELDPPEREKLVHLAQIMAKRPTLKLQVPETVDPKADREQIQFDMLDARMHKELGNRDTVKRQRGFLENLYEERIGDAELEKLKPTFEHKPEGKPNADPVLDEPALTAALRDAVAKTEPVDDARLAQLGKARADAVAGAMRQIPGFDPRRIAISGSATVEAAEDGDVPLKFDAGSMDD